MQLAGLNTCVHQSHRQRLVSSRNTRLLLLGWLLPHCTTFYRIQTPIQNVKMHVWIIQISHRILISITVLSNFLGSGSSSAKDHSNNTSNSNNNVGAQPLSLDEIVHQILSTSSNYGQLNHAIKNQSVPKDIRDTILASTLSNGHDPISVLDARNHTLGLLYIL